MRSLRPVLIVLLLAAGCGEEGPMSATDNAAFSGQAAPETGGNPYFRFLPPVAPQSSKPFPEAFNPDLEVYLRINCAPAELQRTGVSCAQVEYEVGGAVLDDDAYAINWNTATTPLLDGRRYSVKVVVGVTALDSMIVEPVANPQQLRDVPPAFYGFQNGRTVPVRFWIGEKAVCWARFGTADCTETTVPPTGIGLHEQPTCLEGQDKTLCIAVDQDPDGITELIPGQTGTIVPVVRTISMRLVAEVTDPNAPGGRCLNNLPRNYRQALGCYEVVADPPLEPFEQFKAEKVWVAYCLDPRVDRPHHWTRYKSKSGSFDIPLTEAPDGSTVPAFIVGTQCAAFNDRFAAAPRWLRGAFAFLFGGPAYAGDIDRFSNIRELSFFGWVREISLTAPAVTALTGQVTLAARVGADHEAGAAVAGVGVAFQCTAGPCANAATTSALATSSATGWAQTTWTFTAAGSYHFTASTPADGAVPVEFIVIIEEPVQWGATFLPPLAGKEVAPLAEQNLNAAGFVRITCIAGSCVGAPPVQLAYGAANLNTEQVYEVRWRIEGVAPGDRLVVTVTLGATPLTGGAEVLVAGEERFNIGRMLPIKFRIER
jgi:hypothetical protein